MKQLNSKFLICLLVMSFCSASMHASVDHDDSGCEVCIQTTTHKDQVLVDNVDDVEFDLGILFDNESVLLLNSLNAKDLPLTIVRNHTALKQYSIRAPPYALSH